MSRAELVKALTLAFAACAAASVLQESATQEPPDELTPRAISDSTYGVRVTVDALAETIRHGELDLRQLNDPELGAAVARLSSAVGRRSRQPPRRELGILWDFRIDIADFQTPAPDVLRARAHVFLATEGDSASTLVTFIFRRRGDRWALAAYEGFAARLVEIAARLGRGSRS